MTYQPAAADFNRFFRGKTYGTYDIFTPRSYAQFVRANDIDLSRAVNRFDGERLIGTLVYAVRGERAWFGLIGVDAQRRRAGLGAALVDEAIANVRRAGVRSIELEIVQRNAAAREMVQRRGFVQGRELLVWSRRHMPVTQRAPAPRTFTETQIRAMGGSPSCWQREARSVAASGRLAPIEVPGGYALLRTRGDAALVADAWVRDERSAHALLRSLDERIAGELTLNNEAADSALSGALHASGWRVVERQHVMVLTQEG